MGQTTSTCIPVCHRPTMQAKLIHKEDSASVGKAMQERLSTEHLLPTNTPVVTTAAQDDDELDVMCYCMKGFKADMEHDREKWGIIGFMGFIICVVIGVSIPNVPNLLLIMSMVGLGIMLASIGFVVCKYACFNKA